jgi:hypothetical protein
MRTGGTRRRLLIVWVLLAVLVGAILYAQRNDLMSAWQETDDGHGHSGPRDLVTVPLEELGALEIVERGTVHRFERDGQGRWFYHGAHGAGQEAHEHQTDAAAAERIDKAFTAFTRTRIERRFTVDFAAPGGAQAERSLVSDDNVRDYGVTVPSMLILLYQPRQVEPLARYAVGDVAPDTYSRYIQRLGSQEVVTIANYQIQNLEQLIAALSASGAPPAAAPSPAAPAAPN